MSSKVVFILCKGKHYIYSDFLNIFFYCTSFIGLYKEYSENSVWNQSCINQSWMQLIMFIFSSEWPNSDIDVLKMQVTRKPHYPQHHSDDVSIHNHPTYMFSIRTCCNQSVCPSNCSDSCELC